jgi:hypothetical protein
VTDDLDKWQLSPTERFDRSPRPLNYIRVRLSADGQADYILELMQDEKEELLRELADLRIDGKEESDPDIQECRTNLNHLIRAISDVERGKIELVG